MSLRVGSWPGYQDSQNQFIHNFLGGLEKAGAEVVSLNNIDAFADQNLDIILLHWAERIFFEAGTRWVIPRKISEMMTHFDQLPEKTKIVWLVHNLKPHAMRRTQRLVWPFYTRALVRRVDAALTLAPDTMEPVRAAFPGLRNKPVSWAWHPAYPDARMTHAERSAARRARGWGDEVLVLGNCGQIRRNKGLEQLTDAFCRNGDPHQRLLIAGFPSDAKLVESLRARAAQDPRIQLELHDLSHAQFREAINCCDVVVAPFRDYLHSGSLVHAVCAGRALLTPNTPFARSLQSSLGAEWVHLYEGPLAPERLDNLTKTTGQPDLSNFDAKFVGTQVMDFFRKLASGDSIP